ncbi:clustered mitochondria protein 1 [[Candida] anglica]|uniref:Clustered mitochondria protein homolog n=1 Tax=[Candida] anglica TaxID=148631 RepID=A0ABP0EHZ5_9ASCO
MADVEQKNSEAAAPVPEPQTVEVIDVKIVLPGCISSDKPITIPSTLNATLGELKQSFSIIHVLRNLTSYDIFYQNVNLTANFDDLFELKTILEELNVKDTKSITFTLKEKPYILSSVYQHLEKFRESIGLHFLDKSAFSLGNLSGASKFNELGLAGVKQQPQAEEEKEIENKEESKEESEKVEKKIELTSEEKDTLQELSNNFLTESVPLIKYATFQSPSGQLKVPLKSLSVSSWSPVPPHQKIRGDLLYLVLQTLENETFQITCHLSGFFVNKCSAATFNPSIKINENGKFHKQFILFDLVNSLSPLFSKTIEQNEQKLSSYSENPEAYLIPSNCFVSSPWIVNAQNFVNQPDVSRSQLPLLDNGVDGSDNVKDWNEDIQAIRELPKATIDERILREQLLNKSSFDFTAAAVNTAISVIRGDVPSINPQDEADRRVYLRNGIFYFMNVNDSGVFDATGGNEAARYTSSKDLASTRILNKIDAPGISNLVTCIVDYMGKRVVCQAPVPGIFNNPVGDEEQNKVAYGLSVERNAIYQDESFDEALKPIAEALHLKAHEVTVSEDVKSEGKLAVSKDTKGIKGSDGRKYLMDLYKSTPLDIEFIEANWNDQKDDSYPHRETVLRHEAIEEWWKRKVSVLFKAETERLEKEGKTGKEGEEKPQIVLPSDQIVFNPDAFTGINESAEDQQEVRELSKFITEQLIPEFLKETASQIAPFDGSHLSKSLHNQGINLRYLGAIAEQALVKKAEETAAFEEVVKDNTAEIEKRKAEEEQKSEEKDEESKEEEAKEEESKEETPSKGKFDLAVANLDTLHKIAVQEMIARAVKHILRKSTADLPEYLVSHFVAHFHNCLLGSQITGTPECALNADLKSLFSAEDLSFTTLTSQDVFKLVEREVFVRFRYTLPENWATSSDLLRHAQLFREIAIKFGIQWKAQSYVFTKEEFESEKEKLTALESTVVDKKRGNGKNKKRCSPAAVMVNESATRSTVFIADDIAAFVPVIKDSTFRSTLLDELYEVSRVHIYKGETEIGLTLLNELLSFCEQIYGRVHPETTKFYSSLAQIYSELDMKTDACNFGRKACILTERTAGFDSYETILAYINASFYEGQNDDPVSSFKLYSRVLSDWNVVYGKDHPSSVNTVTNLADSLSQHEIFGPSHALYENILAVSENLNGATSPVSGMIRYRYARSLFASQDIKGALAQFKKANEIFSVSIGPDDIFSKETKELVSKFEDHIKYTTQMQLEAKKNEQAQKAQAALLNATKKPVEKKKNGKKQQNVSSVPEIASQSVDDILQFIEGKKSTKSKKSKKATK